MQFIGVAHIGPDFGAHFGDCGGIEAADFREHGFGQRAAHLDGAGATLFEWRVIEIGVRIGVQDFVRELRRNRRIDREAIDLSVRDARKDLLEAVHVHGFAQRVLHRLAAKG